MEIWLKQNEVEFRFAVLPAEYELGSTSNNTTENINAVGEVSLIGKRNLKTISLASFFPAANYDFCQYSTFPKPLECVEIIEKIKEKGVVRLIITGTQINMECTIESFVWGQNDGTKDINFTLELREYRRIKVYAEKKKEVTAKKIIPAVTKRAAKEVKNTTYVVVRGDTLCKIAKKITGNSANWKAIYHQNKNVIGGNPNRIFAGQKLVITI